MLNKIRSEIGTAKSHASAKSPSGQIWPNGEFGLGYYQEWEECTRAEEHGYYMVSDPSVAGDYEREPVDLLTLSDVINSHKPETPTKRKNGLNGLTSYGAKMVRNGCFLMEQKLGKEDCFMWTLTVPPLGRRARAELARNWGRLTNRLLQWLSRELRRKGRVPAVIGVVEIQTARLEKTRQGYLHLHLICPGHANNGGRFAVDADSLRAWWKEAIERYSGTVLHVSPRVQVEPVRKSVEAYMGKYLSKGSTGELEAFIEDLGEESVPGQWWFASSVLKGRIRDNKASGKRAGLLLEIVVREAFDSNNFEIFEFIRHCEVEINGALITVGWYGKLKQEIARELIELSTA
jgi:hypothetical protein